MGERLTEPLSPHQAGEPVPSRPHTARFDENRRPLFDEGSDQRRAICACGRFVRDVRAAVYADAIRDVRGTCSVHGRVTAWVAHGWAWEDFYGWGDS